MPFNDKYFDLVISVNSLHNILNIDQLKKAFKEMKRVAKKNIFISVGAYDNKKEREILNNWAVVSTTYMSTKSWLKFFKNIKYNGDFWWFKPK